MRLLYVASDQTLQGDTGGSVHVHEVASALGALGHEVHVVVKDAREESSARGTGYEVHRVRWTPGHRFFRFRVQPQIESLIAGLKPDAVMERYYNFGGEGVFAAERAGVPSLLEVNSPVIDHRGSLKAAIDAVAIVRPMRQWRERIAAAATALISPLKEIVPAFAHAKTHVVTWGANVDAFHPLRRSAGRRSAWGASESTCVALFSGSHRPWHGVHNLEAAARRLRDRRDILFVFAGGERTGGAQDFRGHYLGRAPYGEMPEVVASADVSIAPYDRSKLRSLALGFFWSPLKIFEALASGIPTVTLDIAPLNEIIRGGVEGVFARENDTEDLARTIVALAEDRERRISMGRHARERAPLYSWAAHGRQIESILEGIVRH